MFLPDPWQHTLTGCHLCCADDPRLLLVLLRQPDHGRQPCTLVWLVPVLPGDLLCCLSFCSPVLAAAQGLSTKVPDSAMQMNNCARGKIWTDDPKVAAHS